MEINQLAAIGYGLAAVAFAGLTLLMMSRWRDRPRAGLIAMAAGATAFWGAVQTIGSLGYLTSTFILFAIEWLRHLAWLTVLLAIFRDMDIDDRVIAKIKRYSALVIAGCIALAITYTYRARPPVSIVGVVGGGLALSTAILVLAEQVYRNASPDSGSGLRYFCAALGGIYVYDLVIFVLMILNLQMDVDQWATRGFVNALFALPLAFAARRSFQLSLDRFMPRQFLFYSFALIAIGTMVVITLIGDYYIRTYGGAWSGVLQIILLVLAAIFVAFLMISPTVRARVRVFVTKSFFQYKYDYRKEWLRFISTLSKSESGNVPGTAIRAVAQIVNSPGGVVWVLEENGRRYAPLGAWQCRIPPMATVDHRSSLVRFLKRRQWIIDLAEYRAEPGRYEGLEFEPWVKDKGEWWLIVPLFLRNSLSGFIVLEKPTIAPSLNFEDHDLLRTVGRHVATHIDQAESDRRLAESSQFGTYNRLTAFLMHDLNNLIAQQSLVVKNAEKHRHNPDFVDDAIDTIANSVARMRRLMSQLSTRPEDRQHQQVGVADMLSRAAARCEPRRPEPIIEAVDESLVVGADPDSLTTAVEHLIRNAQDATDEDGEIRIQVAVDDASATISVSDTGSGMTSEFIRERLFRPFDSTKGSQSMGIGAYQAREYVRQLGGQMEVTSTPGEGTQFDIRLPRSRSRR